MSRSDGSRPSHAGRRRTGTRSWAALVGLTVIAVALVVPGGRQASAQALDADRMLWEARFDGPRSCWDDAVDVAASPDGATVFVAGTSTGDGTGRDYATIAYDAASGAELWQSRYDGPAPHVPQQFGSGWDDASALAVHPSGAAVFVTGSSSAQETGRDYATVAYDAQTGDELWVGRYAGEGNLRDSAWAIAVSPEGDTVFVTGESFQGRTGRDFTTVAYDAETGAELWVARYDGLGWLTLANGWDTALAIDTTSDGSKVFVTGYSFGVLTNNNDYATIAYDAENGTELWAARYDSPGSRWDEPFALGVGPDDDTVFVTGSSGDEVARSYATLAYDSDTGEQLWVARYDGPTGIWNAAYALAVSPSGDAVFVTGGSAGAGTRADYATVAYGSDGGEELWAARHDGSANWDDLARAIAATPDGETVVVTGSSDGAGTGSDYATFAYDAATGEERWMASHHVAGDHAQGLAVSPDGTRAFVTGRVSVPGQCSTANGPGTQWATVSYALGDLAPPELKDTKLELTVEGRGQGMTLTARLSELDGHPVSGRPIDFYADGESIGSAITGGDGTATLQAPPRYRGGKHTFEARFEGDDYYRASIARSDN